MAEAKIVVPEDGSKITIDDGQLNVPDNPIIPFIEGDGTGPDIWRATVRVLDAAVEKAYSGNRKISWMEIYAGEKANNLFHSWLPDESVQACRDYLVAIKGPLTTPIGGGIRSLNVALFIYEFYDFLWSAFTDRVVKNKRECDRCTESSPNNCEYLACG